VIVEKIVDSTYREEMGINHCRKSARAYIVQDDKVLLMYSTFEDVYTFPGGGLESGETLEQCVIRECKEETGFIVEPEEAVVQVDEYYYDHLFQGVYFICKIVGTCEKHYTPQELKHGLQSVWITENHCKELFEHYFHKHKDEELKGESLRELTALRFLCHF